MKKGFSILIFTFTLLCVSSIYSSTTADLNISGNVPSLLSVSFTTDSLDFGDLKDQNSQDVGIYLSSNEVNGLNVSCSGDEGFVHSNSAETVDYTLTTSVAAGYSVNNNNDPTKLYDVDINTTDSSVMSEAEVLTFSIQPDGSPDSYRAGDYTANINCLVSSVL